MCTLRAKYKLQTLVQHEEEIFVGSLGLIDVSAL